LLRLLEVVVLSCRKGRGSHIFSCTSASDVNIALKGSTEQSYSGPYMCTPKLELLHHLHRAVPIAAPIAFRDGVENKLTPACLKNASAWSSPIEASITRAGPFVKGVNRALAPHAANDFGRGSRLSATHPKIIHAFPQNPFPPSVISHTRRSISHPDFNAKNPRRRQATEEKGSEAEATKAAAAADVCLSLDGGQPEGCQQLAGRNLGGVFSSSPSSPRYYAEGPSLSQMRLS
jgi:hypothetical protein